jgi:hypothetical protein
MCFSFQKWPKLTKKGNVRIKGHNPLITFCSNRAFHRFGQAELGYSGLVFRLEPIFNAAPAASKTTFASKVVKIDSKIIISQGQSKSLKHSVQVEDKPMTHFGKENV